MSYAVQNDMLVRFGAAELVQLTDIGTPRTGAIVTEVLERAITDASAWIDSYLVGRYALPITDPSALAVLNLHCCNEARYLLMTAQADEAAVKAHDERIAYLKAVAKGDIALVPPVSVPPAAGVGDVVFSGGSTIFSRDSYGSDE